MVGRPSQRSGSGRETLTEVRNWSGETTGGSEVVGRPYQRTGSDQETIPELWKWSGELPEV